MIFLTYVAVSLVDRLEIELVHAEQFEILMEERVCRWDSAAIFCALVARRKGIALPRGSLCPPRRASACPASCAAGCAAACAELGFFFEESEKKKGQFPI